MGFISVLKAVPMQVVSKIAPVTAKAAAHAPELLLAGGGICIVGGTVYACKKTLDVKEVVEERMTEAEDLKIRGAEQSEIVKHHAVTALKVTGEYAVPATLVIGGLALIGLSHNILNKRLIEAVAGMEAYRVALEQYRTRVAADLGPSKELELWNGGAVQKKDVYVEQEDGKIKKQKMEVKVRNDGEFVDPYMVRFSKDTSSEWQNEGYRNMDFIESIQVLATRRLQVDDRLDLNWVYKQLGMKYRPIGNVAGWVKGHGDDCVIISVDESYSEQELEDAYTMGRPPIPDLWLTFNCEGNILNLDNVNGKVVEIDASGELIDPSYD